MQAMAYISMRISTSDMKENGRMVKNMVRKSTLKKGVRNSLKSLLKSLPEIFVILVKDLKSRTALAMKSFGPLDTI